MAKRPLVLLLASTVLIVAAGLSVLPCSEAPYFIPQGPLASVLDGVKAPGWVQENKALGETEFLSQRVQKTLGFDDAVYRVYRRAGMEVGVYLAYWRPGKLDAGTIALHTPDSCWVLAGGEMVARDDRRNLGQGSAKALPANFRRFRWREAATDVEVAFWHLHGGNLSGFPVTGDEGRLLARWNQAITTLRNTSWGRLRKEQVFIRISTNQTIDRVAASDLWPALMAALAPSGVVPRESGTR